MNNFNKKIRPFVWFCMNNFPFIEETFDEINMWNLLCKVVGKLNEVIAKCNETGQQVQELTELFNQLQDYVNHYFDNLDVQEEINNKLDDMAEDGTLTEIISQYLNLNSLITFSTVNDMKNSENLVNGSTCKTLGFYEKNDGGSSIYKIRTITNADVINESTIIALTNDDTLIAELILSDTMCPEQFGCYGDGTHDDTEKLQIAIDTEKIIKTTKTYLISEELKIKNSFIMEDFSKIKVKSGFEDVVGVSISKDTQRRNMNYYINVDANNSVETAIGVGKPRFCNLNLNVINSGKIGVNCGKYGLAGNGGNEFNITVTGNSNGTSEKGVIINNWDSVFNNIVTQDVETGVYIEEGEFICKYLHSWLSETTAQILWSTSRVLENIGYRRIMIDWLYQDSVRYGIYGGCYGKIKYFEYNLNLENPSNYNNEVNLYSPSSLTRLFIDIFTNIKNENSLMKYTLNSSNANEFGVLIKNGVATDTNLIKDYIPFTDVNNAPQVGDFYVTYDILNLPINQGGLVKCEKIESAYLQTYYSVNYKNNGNYYKRMRLNNSNEWSSWFKYSPSNE